MHVETWPPAGWAGRSVMPLKPGLQRGNNITGGVDAAGPLWCSAGCPAAKGSSKPGNTPGCLTPPLAAAGLAFVTSTASGR
ncbi:hypothetical protein [Mycobacterium lepromatosis]|uniref:hypothetical protein n=1 Tax=Mycobacterium lepromatosis TaxID=480418 RepID=UPI000AF1D97E|nr:hypothetical protein [Mycobacterium lepromatosis]